MKITKKTKLVDIIPKGYAYKSHYLYAKKMDDSYIKIWIDLQPSKEDMLKKAQEDYSEGTIFQALKNTQLMLGKYPVVIEHGNIKCKDIFVSINEWLHWNALLKHIKTYAHVNRSIVLFLGDYKSVYIQGSKTIDIGGIENITLKQIKRITKTVKKLIKK